MVTISPRATICEVQQVSVINEDVPNETLLSDTDLFLEQFNLDQKDLSSNERDQVNDLLISYRDIFSSDELDIGHTTAAKHRIDMYDSIPVKESHRRVPPVMYQEVKEHLQDLLSVGIIRPSNSPFASPVVLVRKTDGKLRFCVDYHKLNQNTIKDAYALPRIDEIMDFLIRSQYFSSLDNKMGYYQMEVEEEDKGKTAFTVSSSLGFFEFNRLPFGLTNAPAFFQRLMEHVMGDLHMVECVTFIDDVIVPGKSFHEELTRLQHVFEKIRQNGLKLHPRKCILFQRRVKYCSHIVSNAGVETDPDKLVKLAEWPVPTNVKQLRAFLGFAGYYRRFVS